MRKILTILALGVFLFSSNFDEEKRNIYDGLRLIMTKEEKKEFESLKNQDELKNFVNNFWKERDPDPSTPRNEAEEVYLQRLRAAKKYFKEPGKKGWLTDRGRTFLLLGPPSKRELRMIDENEADRIASTQWDYQELNLQGNTGDKNAEVWFYNDYRLTLVFLDERGTHQFFLHNPPPSLLSYLERAKEQFLPKGIVGEEMEVLVDVNRSQKKLFIHIPLYTLSYKKKDGKFLADINLIFLYTDVRTNNQKSFSKEMKFEVEKREIKDKKKQVTIPLLIASLKGKYIIEIIIKDLISNKEVKKRYKLKI